MKQTEKQIVFQGSLEECRKFARANRFSVLLSGLEIRLGCVFAWVKNHDGI